MVWGYLKALPVQTKISSGALVAANLWPIAGVFLLGWNAGTILLTYWAENAVIGLFTVLKMALAKGEPAPEDAVLVETPNKGTQRKPATREVLIPFFLLHFGLFMLAHLAVLAAATGILDDLEKGIVNISIDFTLLAALLSSHGLSFAVNFVGRKELQKAPPSQFFFAPYPRVAIMHIAVIFSVFAGLSVIVLVLLKTLFDLVAHIYEHQEFGKPRVRMGAGGFAAVK